MTPTIGEIIIVDGQRLICLPADFDCEYCYFLHRPGCTGAPPCIHRPDGIRVIYMNLNPDKEPDINTI